MVCVSQLIKRRFSPLAQRFFSQNRPPKVAIVGSGPAGMFACGALLRRSNASIDVFEAAPVPFGLVRYGVAPDHQEVKNCIHGFDKMFEANRDRLSLFCNVKIGSDITFEELVSSYDSVLLAYGAHQPRKLQIPGSDAKNVFSGSDFVSWYNGVPKAQKPLLDTENVIIIGNGNVALDCARIISNGTNNNLRDTDIPLDCLNELENSKVKNIKIFGRRGPLDISFTVKELREQFKVPKWDTIALIGNEQMTQINTAMSSMQRKQSRLIKVLLDGVKESNAEKLCEFHFNRMPEAVIKDSDGRVAALRVMNKLKSQIEEYPCGLLIYSIGYKNLVLSGIPKNEKEMIDMKDNYRVNMPSSSKAKVYAAGWCAHGPKGVIVDTQLQSSVIADEIAKDLSSVTTQATDAKEILVSRNIKFIDWNQWKSIDKEEQERGQEKGKIREKVLEFERFLKK